MLQMAMDAPPVGPPPGVGTSRPSGVSKSTATAVTGVGVGAVGGYTIFTIAHLDEMFSKGAGSFAGMFYALACFAALGLVAVFMNTQVKDNPERKLTPVTMIVTGVFALLLVVAIGVLGFRALRAPELCNGAPCVSKTTLTAIFDRYADIAGFSFPIDSLPGGTPATVKASLNDGKPHDFEKDGTLLLDVAGGEKSVTVSVENLKILEGAYSTLASRYGGLLKKEAKIAKDCKSQLYAAQLSGDCRNSFVALVSSANFDEGPSQ